MAEKDAGSNATEGWGARLQRADESAFFFCYRRIKNPVFDVLMPALSVAANRGFLWVATAALMLYFGHDALLRPALEILAAVALTGIFAECTIKLVWRRKRPFVALEGVTARIPSRRLIRRSSFPSGHSASYFAAAFVLTAHFPQFAVFLWPLAALGALSRAYCGVHYLSDVVVGSILGIGCGWGAQFLFRNFW